VAAFAFLGNKINNASFRRWKLLVSKCQKASNTFNSIHY
jgi:hypothetical protein